MDAATLRTPASTGIVQTPASWSPASEESVRSGVHVSAGCEGEGRPVIRIARPLCGGCTVSTKYERTPRLNNLVKSRRDTMQLSILLDGFLRSIDPNPSVGF